MRTLKLTFVVGTVTAAAAAVTGVSALATAPGKNGQIAFHRFYGRGGVTAGIFVMNPDGSGVRQVTSPAFRTQDEAPDFSPDASNLLFTHRDSHFTGSIWRVNVNGGGRRRLDPRCPAGGCQNEGASGAVYSPNGKLVAFSRVWGPAAAHHPPRFSALYLMSAAGKNLKVVFKTTSLAVSDPGWSPDGRQIAFVRTRSGGRHALFIVAANGGKPKQLTPYRRNGIDRPDFAPDGTMILFRIATRALGQGDEGGNYWTVRPGGGGLRQLTHFGPKVSLASARFSPDGQSIVFGYEPNGGESDIYTMHVDGTGLTRLTSDPGWESSVDWGPAR